MSPSIQVVEPIQYNIELLEEINIEVGIFNIRMVRCDANLRLKS